MNSDIETEYDSPETARLAVTKTMQGLGLEADVIEDAIVLLEAAMTAYPKGYVITTYSTNPDMSMKDLIAIWWQDDDYGVRFNELLWSI